LSLSDISAYPIISDKLKQNNPAAIKRPFHGHGVGDHTYPTLARKNSTIARIIRNDPSVNPPCRLVMFMIVSPLRLHSLCFAFPDYFDPRALFHIIAKERVLVDYVVPRTVAESPILVS
jgi:hypothetical protein